MADDTHNPQTGSWRSWGGAAFAAIWGIVGALAITPPPRGFLEEASAYAGKLFGMGLVYGLVAAAAAHLLILRGQSGKAKAMAYLIGGLAGGLCAIFAHG